MDVEGPLIDTHSRMSPDEYARASGRDASLWRVRLWCDAWIGGKRVRFSVECARGMEDRARRWLERQQAANHAGRIVREHVVSMGGGGWDEPDR